MTGGAALAWYAGSYRLHGHSEARRPGYSGRNVRGLAGEVSEWLKELVSKTSRANTLVGSNPTLSATNTVVVLRRWRR